MKPSAIFSKLASTVFSLALFCSLLACADASTGKVSVWTVTGTQRLLGDATPNPAREVRIYAARNEYESFQIFLRSDRPVKIENVIVNDLRGPDGSVIESRNVMVYRQHQLFVSEASYRNSEFKQGLYPDALIPLVHPLTREPLRGARFVAVPVTIPANETHGFWFDVYVPKGAKAGMYVGNVRIVLEKNMILEIPVHLKVWDFSLPDVPSFYTYFGNARGKVLEYYEQKGLTLSDKNMLETQIDEELKRHRINSYAPRDWVTPKKGTSGEWSIPSKNVEKLRAFIDSYNINAVNVPSPRSFFKDPELDKNELTSWLKALDNMISELNRPEVLFFIYLWDEPSSADAYKAVRSWGSAIRSANTKVKVLVTEQTVPENPSWGDLYGAVDIWVPLFSLYDEESAEKRKKLGEMIWCYTALAQGKETPWWLLDKPLLNYRVPFWIAWRYGIKGILYWGSLAHWREVTDPWTDPRTHKKAGGKPIYNGEGNLVYPARDVGFDGIVPSMRLKAIRDGIEDYEYFVLLEKKGLGGQAKKLVESLAKSWFDWNKDPNVYEQTRIRLGTMLEGAK